MTSSRSCSSRSVKRHKRVVPVQKDSLLFCELGKGSVRSHKWFDARMILHMCQIVLCYGRSIMVSAALSNCFRWLVVAL